MNEIVRVGVYTVDGNFPFKINKNKSLKENVLDICKEANLSAGDSYGLRLIANEKPFDRESSEYIEDLSNITDGCQLELVPSVDIVVKFTFGDPRINFEDLSKYNTDPVFIKHLAYNGHVDTIQVCILQKLTDVEMSISLVTVLQLLKLRYVQNLSPDLVRKLIDMVRNANINALKANYAQSQYIPSVVEHAISVLCQILFSKYEEHKQTIMQNLIISNLLQFCKIWNVNFQVKILRLINTMVKSVKKDQRYTLLELLDNKRNKQCIYDNIINSGNEVTSAMAVELATYQSHILSLFQNTLDTYIDEKSIPKFEEPDRNRLSNILEFQETLITGTQMSYSMETLANLSMDRYSFVSQISRDSICTNQTLSLHSECSNGESYCYLTHESLEHYQREHPINFTQSSLEESAYQVNIIYTSEKVTRMLATVLGIGDQPSKKSENYHPIIFDTNIHSNFFLELFSRTMWLLSKTRKEMKARIAEDFDKLIFVLEKQVMIVLQKKPLNLKQVLECMKEINYQTVSEQLDKDRLSKWRNILKTNPCVMEMMEEYRQKNKKLVYEQRMAVLRNGMTFPKRVEKKATLSMKHNATLFMHVQVTENLKNFKIYSCDEYNAKKRNYDQIHTISTIRHVVTGKNCPHFKDHSNKQEKHLFTLQLEGDVNINFVAPDERTTNYWIDGFNLLLGKDYRSEDYHKDLETLSEMDVALQIMELQDLDIPNSPPPVPVLPKPTVPPKLPHLSKNMKDDLRRATYMPKSNNSTENHSDKPPVPTKTPTMLLNRSVSSSFA